MLLLVIFAMGSITTTYYRRALSDAFRTFTRRYRAASAAALRLGVRKRDIAWQCFVFARMIVWYTIMQYVCKQTLAYDKTKNTLTYAIDGRVYKMIVPPQTSSPPVIMIIDDHTRANITALALPYMGPQRDWYNRPIPFDHLDGATRIVVVDEHGYETVHESA
jgi:hypothetical protein